MRILHTSDWHLGRQLHGLDLGEAQAAFVDHLVDVVRDSAVDVVVISGDVHDRALPPLQALQLFASALRRLRDAGAWVVVISGNHDAAVRLGDKAELMDPRIRLLTDPARVAVPVLIPDEYGAVAFYGIPFLEPAAVAGVLPGADGEEPGAHHRVVARAMRAISADRADRGGRAGSTDRSVVLAHAWVAGGEGSESERDLGVGGVARVPIPVFDGMDYVALGHLHGPQVLDGGRVRYSGSPLPYSFSEAGHTKLCWLIDLNASGVVSVEAVAAPVWRRLSVVRGTLSGLLASREWDGMEADVISAVLTDARRPADAMAALQRRFPHAVTLSFEPVGAESTQASYAARTRGRSELEVAMSFLQHVRGEPDEVDSSLLAQGLEAARLAEAGAV